MKRQFGANHPKDKHTVVFEFNLEELNNIEGWIPRHDGFHKEIMEALEWLQSWQNWEPEAGVP